AAYARRRPAGERPASYTRRRRPGTGPFVLARKYRPHARERRASARASRPTASGHGPPAGVAPPLRALRQADGVAGGGGFWGAVVAHPAVCSRAVQIAGDSSQGWRTDVALRAHAADGATRRQLPAPPHDRKPRKSPHGCAYLRSPMPEELMDAAAGFATTR